MKYVWQDRYVISVSTQSKNQSIVWSQCYKRMDKMQTLSVTGFAQTIWSLRITRSFVISKLKFSFTTSVSRCVHNLHFRHENGSANWNAFTWTKRPSQYHCCSLPLYHGHFHHNSSYKTPQSLPVRVRYGVLWVQIWVMLYHYHCGALCDIMIYQTTL